MRLDSLTNYSVAPESNLESELKRARQRLSLAISLVSVAELVFLHKRRAKKALDLSPNLSGGVGSNPTGCKLIERDRLAQR